MRPSAVAPLLASSPAARFARGAPSRGSPSRRRAWRAVFTLGVVLLLSAAVPAAARPSLALLPAAGAAKEPARRAIDKRLRQAIIDVGAVELQALAETRTHLEDAKQMGMVCDPDALKCLIKLGLVAEVSYLVTVTAEGGTNSSSVVDLLLIDVDAGKVVRELTARLPVRSKDGDDEAVRVAMLRLLSVVPGAPPPPPPPSDDELEADIAALENPRTPVGDVEPDDRSSRDGGSADDPPRVDDRPPRSAFDDAPAGPSSSSALDDDTPDPDAPLDLGFAGLVTAGVGGGVAAASLIGAVVCELVYGNILPLADANARQNVVAPTGATLWVTTIVGAAAAGVGGILFATATVEE